MTSLPKPTEAELAILRVLWRRGPATVREVLAELPRGTGYTTALKLMQIMTEKKLVLRDAAQRSHIYRAAAAEAQTLGAMVGDLFERACGGNWQKLLVAALSARRATPRQLAEMRELLDQAEQNQTTGKGKS